MVTAEPQLPEAPGSLGLPSFALSSEVQICGHPPPPPPPRATLLSCCVVVGGGGSEQPRLWLMPVKVGDTYLFSVPSPATDVGGWVSVMSL